MFRNLLAAGAALTLMGAAGQAAAQGYVVSANGFVALGANAEGHLDTDAASIGAPVPSNQSLLGIAYNFGAGGAGGRTGFQDALSPGCACEGWGVSTGGANSASISRSNSSTGTVSLISQAGTPGVSFTSVTNPVGTGLTVTHAFSRGVETATGALIRADVTLANTSGAALTDVRYGRAMDWDVPPTEFDEFVTHAGISLGGTSNLLRATNNGFQNADPLVAITDGGRGGAVPNTNGDQNGIQDHGSLFVFGFGDLADGESKTFTIFYGAGANLRDALALIGASGAELYSLGQNSAGGVRGDGDPTYIFAFDGVGLPPVIGVPVPAALALFGAGLLGLALVRRRAAA